MLKYRVKVSRKMLDLLFSLLKFKSLIKKNEAGTSLFVVVKFWKKKTSNHVLSQLV